MVSVRTPPTRTPAVLRSAVSARFVHAPARRRAAQTTVAQDQRGTCTGILQKPTVNATSAERGGPSIHCGAKALK